LPIIEIAPRAAMSHLEGNFHEKCSVPSKHLDDALILLLYKDLVSYYNKKISLP
jgi:hypothetical protein